VAVFSGTNHASLGSFFAYAPVFTGGVRVAAGDIDGDGKPEIVTASGSGITTEVKVFAWPSLVAAHDFFPFGQFTGGAFVAAPLPTDVIFVDDFE
jgi:serralysin